VQRLAVDHTLRADLATNGRARVADRDWAHVVAELVEVHYTGAIGHDVSVVAA